MDARTDLPKPIRILFLLNGATEGLPAGLPLLSLINDRVQIPVAYIPMYFAISFLPYSLKPLYAVLTTSMYPRVHWLLVSNLIGSALTLMFTAFLGANAVISCITLAFFRGFFTSFAEFIVGITLISNAKMDLGCSDGYDTAMERQSILLSCYQSQAATSRNIGSFLAQIFVFVNLLNKFDEPSEDDGSTVEGLDDSWITFTFLLTSSFPMASAVCALYFQIGRQPLQTKYYEGDVVPLVTAASSFTYLWEKFKKEIIGLILFQTVMVIIALRTIILEHSSSTTWYFVFFVLVGSLSVTLWSLCRKRSGTVDRGAYDLLRLGSYLILRHMIPTTPGIQSSFSYYLLRAYPFYYQIMGVMNSVVSIFSSWSYGKYISTQFSSVPRIKQVIITTTLALSIMALLFNLPFIRYFRIHIDDWNWSMMILYVLYQLFDSFVREISFLPSVILASNSTIHEEVYTHVLVEENIDEIQFNVENVEERNDIGLTDVVSQKETSDGSNNDAITYGLMIGCLNFGDQIGDLISVPIIQALGIQRDQNWTNMEWFVLICSILSVASLGFLRIVKN